MSNCSRTTNKQLTQSMEVGMRKLVEEMTKQMNIDTYIGARSKMTGIDAMKAHLGLQQVQDNTALREWFKQYSHDGDLDIDPAKISWCACSVNASEREAGNDGTGKLNAQSFKTYGTAVELSDAQEGDILVFHFPFDDTWQGHVTYFVQSGSNNTVQCLGGNQNHMVQYSNYVADYITDVRRPPSES